MKGMWQRPSGRLGACLFALVLWLLPQIALGQASCLSPDPNAWPANRRPYVLFVVPAAGILASTTLVADQCGYGTSAESHLRCALSRTVPRLSGLMRFGLMTSRRTTTGCATGTCSPASGCVTTFVPPASAGCGAEPSELTNSADRSAATLLVQLGSDLAPTPVADNTAELMSWFDNKCDNNKELLFSGGTANNGLLRDAYRYLSDSLTDNVGTWNSPLGSLASGELPCRQVHVVLLTGSSETCDAAADAADASADLLEGFSKDNVAWKVKTHVLRLTSTANAAQLSSIATAGGTSTARDALTDTAMITELTAVLTDMLTTEICDNKDNDCNGCTDEGFTHYGNSGQTCCNWTTGGQFLACKNTWQSTVTAQNPLGDRTKLPCATVSNAVDPTRWLCIDPGEICDNIDNNANGTVDEGTLKCGSPPTCASAEVCDGKDNDCDGVADEGNACGSCTPSAEICDGCDNDCDGIADEGIAAIACGSTSPQIAPEPWPASRNRPFRSRALVWPTAATRPAATPHRQRPVTASTTTATGSWTTGWPPWIVCPVVHLAAWFLVATASARRANKPAVGSAVALWARRQKCVTASTMTVTARLTKALRAWVKRVAAANCRAKRAFRPA
jgi:hypothetical protein